MSELFHTDCNIRGDHCLTLHIVEKMPKNAVMSPAIPLIIVSVNEEK